MKIKSVQFEASAPGAPSYPAAPLPEFAFIGRSNVGKSSLINLLAEQKDLARVSDTPGKTTLINFYLVNEAWRLVDLPGYGFAAATKTDRADFNEAAADYLQNGYDGQAAYVILAHLSESNNLPELARVAAERALLGHASLLANKLILAEQNEPLTPIYF